MTMRADTCRRGERDIVGDEDGIVLAIVVVILFIVLLVVGVITSVAISANDKVQHDRGAKAAQEAADAGLNLAAYRLTQIQPESYACPVITSAKEPLVPAGTDQWCPEVPVVNGDAGLGEGQSATYRVSVNGTPSSYNSRTVVSVGRAPGRAGGTVSSRVTATIGPPPPTFVSKLALAASKNVDLGNDSVIRENATLCGAPPYVQGTPPMATDPSGLDSFDPASFCGPLVAVGGRLNVGASAHLCGYTFMNSGKIYRNNVVGALQGPGQNFEGCTPTTTNVGDAADKFLPGGQRVLVHGSSAASGSLTVPDIAPPPDIANTNNNCRLTTLFAHPANPVSNSYSTSTCPFPSGKLQWNAPSAGPDPTTTWDPDSKTLVIKGGNKLTLPAGDYFFCYLEVGGSSNPELHFSTSPGVQTHVYIGDPTDPGQCGSNPPLATVAPAASPQTGRALKDDGNGEILPLANWGSVVLHNNGTIVNDDASSPPDPRKLQFMMIGSEVNQSNTSDEFVNGGTPGFMSMMLTAPHSSVSFVGGGGTAQVAALRAESVSFGGNNNAVAWDDRIALTAGGWQKFTQKGWYQCRPTSNGQLPPEDPTTNC